MRLANRSIVITGGSQGFGKAVAEACLREGAHLLLCARGVDTLNRAAADLSAKAAPGQVVLSVQADVSNEEDVARLMEVAVRDLPSFDGLVNNAGVHGPKGLLEDVDVDQWWDAIRVNLLSIVLTCRKALPVFRRQGRGKIVNLSGGGATKPMPRVSAYAASKAALVRLTETLAHEAADTGIDINAVAPGAMNTRLLDDMLDQGPEFIGQTVYEQLLQQKKSGGTPLETGAELCTYLLSSQSDGISGRLISAVWDPWLSLATRRDALAASDIFTLRRIVPEDRGQKWEE